MVAPKSLSQVCLYLWSPAKQEIRGPLCTMHTVLYDVRYSRAAHCAVPCILCIHTAHSAVLSPRCIDAHKALHTVRPILCICTERCTVRHIHVFIQHYVLHSAYIVCKHQVFHPHASAQISSCIKVSHIRRVTGRCQHPFVQHACTRTCRSTLHTPWSL